MAGFLSLIGVATLSLLFLFIGLTLGFAMSRANKLAAMGLAFFVGSLVWLSSLLFSRILLSLPFFVDYVLTLNVLIGFPLILGSQVLTATLALIALLEIGYLLGFVSARPRESLAPGPSEPRPLSGMPRSDKLRISVGVDQSQVASVADSESSPGETGASAFAEPQLKSPISPASDDLSREIETRRKRIEPTSLSKNITEDEKTIATSIVAGKLHEVMPKLDDATPDGYYYDHLRDLGWDLQRQVATLDTLVARGYLNSSPVEKVLRCKQCGSMRLQLRSECPECSSPRTEKHKVYEHFSCGMIDKEENFRAASGELICPKCNKVLELIGADYRSLGSMHVCLQCGALSKDPLTIVKCSRCGLSAKPEEEVEDYLLSYTVREQMLPKMQQLVKPVKTFSNYFENQGFTVFSPALVRGRSGTEHGFDMLLLKKSPLGGPPVPKALDSELHENKDRWKLIVEVLQSDSKIKLGEMTSVFGKLNDVVYDSLVIAIPSMDEEAKNYAATYGMKVLEGNDAQDVITKLQLFLKEQEKEKSEPALV